MFDAPAPSPAPAPAACTTAVAYLETGPVLDLGGFGSVAIEIGGVEGTQEFALASGAAQASIIAAINAFAGSLGVGADPTPGNPDRVRLSSAGEGPAAFVSVQQIDTDVALVYADPLRGEAMTALIAAGASVSPGDLDCDGAVGMPDLLLVLVGWGPCAAPPPPCAADLDGDGRVGGADLEVLFRHWTE
jgi:hypothetical protein